MALILDTGVVYASYDRRDRWHRGSVELLKREPGELIVPAAVIPEVDHLLRRRLGSEAQLLFYRGLSDGAYYVADLPREGYSRVLEINTRFRDLGLGFVDAAVLAIAEMLDLRRVATTDRRHFGVVKDYLRLELLP